MAAATRNLPAPKYFEAAMSHRFCLNAPGDFVYFDAEDHRIRRTRRGGRLPAGDGRARRAAGDAAVRAVARLVRDRRPRLRGDRARRHGTRPRPAARDDRRRRRRDARAPPRGARDAFVWRPPAADPVAQPSAADFVLGGEEVPRELGRRRPTRGSSAPTRIVRAGARINGTTSTNKPAAGAVVRRVLGGASAQFRAHEDKTGVRRREEDLGQGAGSQDS